MRELPDWLVEDLEENGFVPPSASEPEQVAPPPPPKPTPKPPKPAPEPEKPPATSLTLDDLVAVVADLTDRVKHLEQRLSKTKSADKLGPRITWRDDPIVVPGAGPCKQFITLTQLLRQKDLAQVIDPGMLAKIKEVAVFHDLTGKWPLLPTLTKGEASDMIAVLVKLPNVRSPQVQMVHE